MIRKIFTQIWNCRRANLWIWTLLIAVTLLMWYAFDIVYNYEAAAHKPMGYNYAGVYNIELRYRDSARNNASWDDVERLRRSIKDLLRDYPGVEAVSWRIGSAPFSSNRMFEGYCTHDDSSHTVSTYIRYVNPEHFDVYEIQPIYGSVDRDTWNQGEYPMPAVLTEDFADSLFMDASRAVGRTFFNPYYLVSGRSTNYRVAAVVPRQKFDDYELYEPMIYLPVGDNDMQMSTFSVRVRPEARAGFAERFSKDMRRQMEQGVYYLYAVRSLEECRETFNVENGTVNYLNATYGMVGFFLFTVFLIVLGTFSIRTRRRRSEIGLRMAMGSSRRRVMTEFIMEGVLILLMAALPALLIAVNMAHAELTVNTLTDMSAGRFIACFAATVAVLALVIILAVWPSARKAMMISPAEALHDE